MIINTVYMNLPSCLHAAVRTARDQRQSYIILPHSYILFNSKPQKLIFSFSPNRVCVNRLFQAAAMICNPVKNTLSIRIYIKHSTHDYYYDINKYQTYHRCLHVLMLTPPNRLAIALQFLSPNSLTPWTKRSSSNLVHLIFGIEKSA